MAIDEKKPATLDEQAQGAPVIDNEIPAYRAISPGAVLSLILGLVSIFCYADLTFLLVAAGAVVVGLLSIRKIRQFPEILTGRRFATAGIILAAFFGATSLTRTVSNYVVLRLQAQQFANKYLEAIRSQSTDICIWYMQSPDYRKDKKPLAIVEEFKKQGGGGKGRPDMFEEKVSPLKSAIARLSHPNETIRYAGIESSAEAGLETYAHLLFELDGPGTAEHPAKQEFLMVETMKPPGGGSLDWVVRDFHYPYAKASSQAVAPHSDDDGHGHGQ